ncbi:MAG: FAD-dependent monooxygenase [Paracoccaceae bacterium]
MSYPKTVPVVIVGSGPTGLTAGLLLAAYGVGQFCSVTFVMGSGSRTRNSIRLQN